MRLTYICQVLYFTLKNIKMSQLNANTPYIECFIRNNYIFGNDNDGLTEGYIFGVKSMINRPMHFHFQACFGAVFWNMPISAFCHKEDYDQLSDDEQREKIINDLKTIYEDYWKMFNQINTSIKLYLNIKVENLDNLKIMSFEKNLMSIDLINDFFITKFDKDHTYYQIVFNGTLETFLKTMNFYNYDFDTQNKIWVLR